MSIRREERGVQLRHVSVLVGIVKEGFLGRVRGPEMIQHVPRNRAQNPVSLLRLGLFPGVASDAPPKSGASRASSGALFCIARLLFQRGPKPESVADYRQRTKAHRRAGNHRIEEKSE